MANNADTKQGELGFPIYGLIVDTNSGDYGDAKTYYSPTIPMGIRGLKYFSSRIVISNTTVTMETSNDGTTWVDQSTLLLGAANITATTNIVYDDPAPFAFLRFKALTTNASNTLDIIFCAI